MFLPLYLPRATHAYLLSVGRTSWVLVIYIRKAVSDSLSSSEELLSYSLTDEQLTSPAWKRDVPRKTLTARRRVFLHSNCSAVALRPGRPPEGAAPSHNMNCSRFARCLRWQAGVYNDCSQRVYIDYGKSRQSEITPCFYFQAHHVLK